MKLKNRKPLGLEALEDRWVPATVRFDGSNLFVSNPLITAGASALTVTEVAGTNDFKVMDGAGNNGTYAVTGNITVTGNNAKDTITVVLDATDGLTGNLSVSVGNGASGVSVDSSGAGTATLFGNDSINMGQGLNTVTIGTGNGMNTRGTTSVRATGSGLNSVTLGDGAASASTFSGPATVFDFPTAQVGGQTADVFASNVSVQNSTNSSTSAVNLSAFSSVLGNLTVLGGQGATTVKASGTVLGALNVYLGNNSDSVVLGAKTIGSLNYLSGNGANTFTTGAATVVGNANLNWGNGANSFGTTTGLTVEGSLSVNNGNGSLDAGTTAFEGAVYGNLNVNTGNGNNSFTLDGAGTANVLGSFNYTGGNGGNSITVTTQASDFFTLNVRMGNNPGTGSPATSNVFQIGTAPGVGFADGTLTGLVSWGIPSSAANGNAFIDDGYVWTNAITLINIPS